MKEGRHTAEDLAFLRQHGFVETAAEIERLHKVEDTLTSASPRYRHKKRGTLYRVIATDAHLQYATAREVEEDFSAIPLTVYQALDTGQVYVRPTDEFNDGRFEKV